MVYAWKTLNHEFYEMTPWYSQYSKKIKPFALTRETIALQVENTIIRKLWKWPLNIANILNNLKLCRIKIKIYKFMQNMYLKM